MSQDNKEKGNKKSSSKATEKKVSKTSTKPKEKVSKAFNDYIKSGDTNLMLEEYQRAINCYNKAIDECADRFEGWFKLLSASYKYIDRQAQETKDIDAWVKYRKQCENVYFNANKLANEEQRKQLEELQQSHLLESLVTKKANMTSTKIEDSKILRKISLLAMIYFVIAADILILNLVVYLIYPINKLMYILLAITIIVAIGGVIYSVKKRKFLTLLDAIQGEDYISFDRLQEKSNVTFAGDDEVLKFICDFIDEGIISGYEVILNKGILNVIIKTPQRKTIDMIDKKIVNI